MKTLKFKVNSVEATTFGNGDREVSGLILNLAEPIPEVIGSLHMIVHKPTENDPNKYERESVRMVNVTELYVTDDVLSSNNITYDKNDDGTITVEVRYLDVSKPSTIYGNAVRPSKTWIVNELFIDVMKKARNFIT